MISCKAYFRELNGLHFSRAKDHVLPTQPLDSAKNVDEGKEDSEEIKIAGGSMIVNPLGTILAGPLRGEEGSVYFA